jgi:hypothetical protein
MKVEAGSTRSMRRSATSRFGVKSASARAADAFRLTPSQPPQYI